MGADPPDRPLSKSPLGPCWIHGPYDFVWQKVTTKAQLRGGNQHPVLKGRIDPTVPLLKIHM